MVHDSVSDAVDVTSESPQLLSLVKDMKSVLDTVRLKVQALTQQVKEGKLPTIEGISYLEAKHLLLSSYCESIVYYILRKAKGLSIAGHPVVQNLVEIRLFLEKIHPIDKKLEYQIQKLTRAAASATAYKSICSNYEKNKEVREAEEDPLKYRPHPDLLVSKLAPSDQEGHGVYRPPKIAPASMEEEDKLSKQEKQERRREKNLLRHAEQNEYIKELIDNIEDKPEEIREVYGSNRELKKYLAQCEERDRQEEELFNRAPITKREKKLEKHMKKSQYGLVGLMDDFFDEIKTLPLEEEAKGESSFANSDGRRKTFKKRKTGR